MSEKILLLRYSDFHGVDTICEHRAVLARSGHCWWAKIGKQPGLKYMTEFMSQEERIILLYTSGKLYKCEMGSVVHGRPYKDYPQYYERDIFGTASEPSVFFELLSMVELPLSFLQDYVVCRSGKEVLHDLKNSISSYMLIQDKQQPIVQPQKRGSRPRLIVDKYSCEYKVDGKCTRKSCINYGLECKRPQYCIKQKPVKKIQKEE